jgi:hypothetical protein
MKAITERRILRWIHLTFSLPILGYIYGPAAEVEQYASFFRFGFMPVVIFTGLLMWWGPAVRRLVSRSGHADGQA